jgi:transposase
MQFEYFIGIDVSKGELDFSVVKSSAELFHMETTNSQDGIRAFIKKLKSGQEFDFSKCLFCMEHTGIYNNHLLEYLTKKKAHICVESAIHIKQSSGLQRGKNDRVDAFRIAMYAYKNRDELKLWQPKRDVIKKLISLTALRNRIINALKQLRTALNEDDDYVDPSIHKKTKKLCDASMKALDKDLSQIEREIQDTIKSDTEVDRLFKIITSVDGIGVVTATQIIISTNEFKDITEARKFACYSGVAPFEHSSGSSIRGKKRVSRMANKKVKVLLHMAAIASITMKGEMREYFDRKVKEGKNKMAVINAIRNKCKPSANYILDSFQLFGKSSSILLIG